jgi:hypothetical protein
VSETGVVAVVDSVSLGLVVVGSVVDVVVCSTVVVVDSVAVVVDVSSLGLVVSETFGSVAVVEEDVVVLPPHG